MKLRGRLARGVLSVWLIGCFAFSAVSNLAVLGAALLAVAVLLPRQALRAARRTLLVAVPLVFGVLLLTWLHARFVLGQVPDLHAYAALLLRAALLGFATFSVLAAVDLWSALAGWPTLTRLLVVSLAQIHALRLLARESWLGLQSRLPRKPRARDGLANAGGITATMLTLANRNARDIADAMRSRGF